MSTTEKTAMTKDSQSWIDFRNQVKKYMSEGAPEKQTREWVMQDEHIKMNNRSFMHRLLFILYLQGHKRRQINIKRFLDHPIGGISFFVILFTE